MFFDSYQTIEKLIYTRNMGRKQTNETLWSTSTADAYSSLPRRLCFDENTFRGETF